MAPSHDLDAFKLANEMMSNKLCISKYCALGKQLHASLVRHRWHLTSQLVILLIANGDLLLKERAGLAQMLLGFDFPQPDDFDREQPQPPTHVVPMSVLSDIVTKESWLLFPYLSITTGVINSWIKDNFENDSYRHFQHQVQDLAVLNDSAERHIKHVQDFMAQSHDEGLPQDTMQVVQKTEKREKNEKKWFYVIFM